MGLPALLAGMAVTLGFAPFGAWPVAVVGVAIFYGLLVRAGSLRQAIGLCFIWGFGWQLTALHWLPRSFYIDAGRDIWAAIFGGIPGLFGIAAVGCLWLCAVGAGVWLNRGGRWAPVMFLGCWIGVEVLRSLHPMGFPWLLLGAMAGDWPVLAQLASVGGVYLLSGLFLVLAILLENMWRVWVENGRGWRLAKPGLLMGLVLVGWSGFGWARLAGAAPEVGDGQRLRLVQPNIQDPLKWDPEVRWRYLEETVALARAPGWQTVDAFVLPENALPFDLQREPSVNVLMREGLAPDQEVVAGTIGYDEEVVNGATVKRYANRFAVMGVGGMTDHSDKVLLVPFGEYVPWRGLIMALPLPGVMKDFMRARVDYTPGTAPRLLDFAGVKALPLVCYEGIFAPYVGAHVRDADLLLNLTSDMWFTGTIALAQHAALARLRAVENGLPLVRVATTGITVVYDGYGREVTRLPVDTAMVRDVTLPEALPATPWRRLTAALR